MTRNFHILTTIICLAFGLPNWLYAQGWEKHYGGNGNEIGQSVLQTSDLGFLAMGTTTSIGNGGRDIYFLKTDQDGIQQWEKPLGGTEDDYGLTMIATNDGGYALIGQMESYAPAGFYLIKLDSAAEEEWSEPISGFSDGLFSLFQASDNTFSIVGSNTDSTSVYLIKTSPLGIELWNAELGNNDDVPLSATTTPDGGWVVTGYALNSSGDPDNKEMFLLKSDDAGSQEWYQLYGIKDEGEEGFGVFNRPNGGYQLFGTSDNFGPVLLVVQTNSTGAQEEVFEKTDFSTFSEYFRVEQLGDDRFVLAYWDFFFHQVNCLGFG